MLLLPGCTVPKEKLYGTWEVESGPAGVTPGMAMEFTPDGKVKIGGKILGQDVPMTEMGTYRVSGKYVYLELKGKAPARSKVIELTETKMVMKDDGTSDPGVFKKKG